MPRFQSNAQDVVVEQLKIHDPITAHKCSKDTKDVASTSKNSNKKQRPNIFRKQHHRRHTIDAWHKLNEPFLFPCRRRTSTDYSSVATTPTALPVTTSILEESTNTTSSELYNYFHNPYYSQHLHYNKRLILQQQQRKNNIVIPSNIISSSASSTCSSSSFTSSLSTSPSSDSHIPISPVLQPTITKRILVTGGAGYIGSHTCLELLNHGYDLVVMDNLINSNKEALHRVELLTGRPIIFLKGDVTHESELENVFKQYEFWAVLHFAAIKAVGESTRIPLEYYHNNLTGTLNLLRVMKRHGVKNLVFSSSATVYGEPEMMPVNETARLGPVTNPYGKTKLFAEEIIRDLYASDPEWNVVLLRYFNPVGAHSSGMIGEHPQGVPNNLLPYVIKVLQGHLPFVHVFGNDFDTVDGTGVRDYVHVCDLATGHLAALKKLEEKPGCKAYNLGTGDGYSVLEIIHAMERATHKKIPYKIEDRRPGDVAICTADASLANKELDWYPMYSLNDMCQDMWRWTQRNPNGYDGEYLP